MKVELAAIVHLDWLKAHDVHVSPVWSARCLSLGEYRVAVIDAEPVGFLRHSWFWGTIPYMELVLVLAPVRRHGIGTALLKHWEAAMILRGARFLMTSSMADEPEPQAWHRRNGYRETGQLTFGSMQPTPEVFFIKEI